MDQSTQTKTCTRCRVALPLDAFSRRSRSADGLQSKCKPCEAARKRELRAMTGEEKAAERLATIKAEKACVTCGVVKELAGFPKHARTIDGRRARCRSCTNAAARGRYQKRIYTPDEIRQAQAAMLDGKTCSTCLTLKTLGEFQADRRKPDGLTSACGDCRNALSKQWRERNQDRVLSNARRWREKNPGRLAELARRWQKENPDRVRATRAAYMAANAEKVAATRRAWNLAHPGYTREWQKLNPEKVRAIARRYRRKNPHAGRIQQHRRRARLRLASVGPVDLAALWIANEGRCQLCGIPIDPALQFPDPMSKSIDHVVPLAKGGSHTQDNLSWTHLTCNASKGARLLDVRDGFGSAKQEGR